MRSLGSTTLDICGRLEVWIRSLRHDDNKNQLRHNGMVSGFAGGPDKEFEREFISSMDRILSEYRKAGWSIELEFTIHGTDYGFTFTISD